MKIGKLYIIGVVGLTAGLLYGHEESVAASTVGSALELRDREPAPIRMAA